MAQVPYQPFPTAQPTSPGERISVSTPPAAFGENIGAALEKLGSTAGQVGNELFGRAIALQDLANENEARDAQISYATQSADMVAKFDAREGKDKVDHLQSHLKDLSDLRNQIADGISSPNAKRMFHADSTPFMQREIFSAATGS